MRDPHVVTVFLRDGGAVLLVRRSDGGDLFPRPWDAIAGHAAGTPDRMARAAIHEETGLTREAVTLVRAGDPFSVTDPEIERRWVVHAYLFDVATREITVPTETTASEWVSPPDISRRETVPGLWRSYERVAPTLETVAADRERGSAALSISALRVLRDRAGVLADRASTDGDTDELDADDETSGDDGWDELALLARALRAARPSMKAVENRVNRVMASVDERRSVEVERAAQRAIERAAKTNGNAADAAVEVLTDREAFAGDESAGPRLITLSRSGTVLETLRRLTPSPQEIVIAESRPGGEGIGVAERVASEHAVTLVTDAAVASVLRERAIDAVLVGADTVYRDGSVLNKVGTRNAAIVAAYENIPVYVVTASAKISSDCSVNADREPRKGSELYDVNSDVAIDAWNPTFDVTPAEAVSGICTERGVLASDEVAAVAEEFAALSTWDEQ